MLIDISPVLRAGMAVWPGDSAFSQERTWQIGPQCPVNVSRLTLSSHTGSHADAPLHYRADGASIDALPLDLFIGPCHLVDASTSPSALIGPAEVLPQLPERVARVLIRQYRGHPEGWDPALRGLDPDLVDALAARGARLVGVDAASVDPADSKTLDAHRRLDSHGIVIIEGLVLDRVPAGSYELIAPPLKIAHGDAAPLRAVLRRLPENA